MTFSCLLLVKTSRPLVIKVFFRGQYIVFDRQYFVKVLKVRK